MITIRNQGFSLSNDKGLNATFLEAVDHHLKNHDVDAVEFTKWNHLQPKYVRCGADEITIDHKAQTIRINHTVYLSHQFKAVSFE